MPTRVPLINEVATLLPPQRSSASAPFAGPLPRVGLPRRHRYTRRRMGHPPRRFPARSVAAPRSTNPPKWAVWRKGNPSPRAVRAPFSHFVTSIDAQRHAPPAQPLSRTRLCRLRTRYPVNFQVLGRRAQTLSAPLPKAYTLRTHPTTYRRAPASYKPLPPFTVRPSRMACEPLKTRVCLMGANRGTDPYAADSRLRFTLRKRLCTPQRPPPSATP